MKRYFIDSRDHGVGFPVTELLFGLDFMGSLCDGDSVGDEEGDSPFAMPALAPAVLPGQEANKLLSLFVDVAVDGFVADGESWFVDFQASADLFWRPAKFYFFTEVGVNFRMGQNPRWLAFLSGAGRDDIGRSWEIDVSNEAFVKGITG